MYLSKFIELSETFWTEAEFVNEDTVPISASGFAIIEVIDTDGNSKMNQVYLKLLNSLLTYSNDLEDEYIRGFSEIAYCKLQFIEQNYKDAICYGFQIS